MPPASTTTCSVAKTISPSTARPPRRASSSFPPAAPRRGRTAPSSAARCVTWWPRPGSGSSWTSGPACPAPTTCTRWRRRRRPSPGWVYVDNDPIVLAHARALLTSTPQGRSAFIDADLCRPETILEAPALRETLDFSEPVALMLVGILHFIPDEQDPAGAVAALVDALPSGSYVTAS